MTDETARLHRILQTKIQDILAQCASEKPDLKRIATQAELMRLILKREEEQRRDQRRLMPGWPWDVRCQDCGGIQPDYHKSGCPREHEAREFGLGFDWQSHEIPERTRVP